jgi:hypothetical protein
MAGLVRVDMSSTAPKLATTGSHRLTRYASFSSTPAASKAYSIAREVTATLS